jgi:trehalose 6-phosphate synthase
MLSQLTPAESMEARNDYGSRRLIMASNRGPVEHWFDENGRIRRRDAAGGVATALSNVAKESPVTWIAGAGSEADKAVAILGQQVTIGAESGLKLLSLPENAYRSFYETFCNPILWFVQHSLGDMLQSRDLARDAIRSWEDGYLPINRLFAETAINEIQGNGADTRVMLHDYHLYLAPRYIRAARPMAAMQQFIHIPWPAPAAWRYLPDAIVRRICGGLLANDSIVFQTESSVENFLATCRAYLGERAIVMERQGSVEYLGQTSFVWANPISVDFSELEEMRASELMQKFRKELAAPEGVRTIVRVDRLDPSKNVTDGFEAYDMLLRRHPELRQHVRFLAFLIPSRGGIPEYCDYQERAFSIVDSINRKYGTPDWTPVTVFYEHNRLRALASLTMYDVLLVNSIADGMNLVSKEGPMLNERDGVLALSYTAGSYDELQHGAVRVNPFDIVDTAAALYEALMMPDAERRLRAAALQESIAGHQLGDWLKQQLRDLAISEHVKRIETASPL